VIIWCLFSIANDYDQPRNNLVTWWQKKPSLEALAKTLCHKLGTDDATTVAVVHVWSGKEARIGDTDYRLEDVAECRNLDEERTP